MKERIEENTFKGLLSCHRDKQKQNDSSNMKREILLHISCEKENKIRNLPNLLNNKSKSQHLGHNIVVMIYI